MSNPIIRYKLTTQDLITWGDCQWVLNEWKETSGEQDALCTSSWLHCYSNPLLAILFNPVHAAIKNPKLFEVEVEGKCLSDFGRKEGWTRMRLVREIAIPEITRTQRIAFGLLCAKKIWKEEALEDDNAWNDWADKWLSGENRDIKCASIICNKAQNYIASHTAYAAYLLNSDFSSYNSDYYAADAAANCATLSCYSYLTSKKPIVNKDDSFNYIELANEAMNVK
jgi:hypothetical protein